MADEIKPALDLEKITVKILISEEIDYLSSCPEVAENGEAMDIKSVTRRINQGWICMGIKYEDLIIAYMWCCLDECDDKLLNFKLRDDEAYLTYAYTLKAYRGKVVAPFLRVELYKYLETIGRRYFLSISECLNEPAIRFKKKLNARFKKLYLYICFFKYVDFRIPLKSYI